MRKLFTCGYEGVTISAFIATLREAGVSELLDVRELAISRKLGFSKAALSVHLAAAGIAYRHERRLGSPTAMRNRVREDRDYPGFFRAFDQYLESSGDYLAGLVPELGDAVALMCFERDVCTCHRKSVAAAISLLTGIEAQHLTVRAEAAQQLELDAVR